MGQGIGDLDSGLTIDFLKGIYPPDYEDDGSEDDNEVGFQKEINEEEDIDIDEVENSDHQSDEAALMAAVIQEINGQQPRATVASVSEPSQSSAERKKDIVTQVMQEQRLFDTSTKAEAVVKQELAVQVIQEHSYAKSPQLETSVSQSSHVVNSQQPRANVASYSGLLRYTAASASFSSSTSRTVKQSLAESKKDIVTLAMQEQKQEPRRASGTSIIDLTMAVTGNEEEEVNNNKLVDWPPVYIEDYKRLGEGSWLNTNILDFYMNNLSNNLSAEKRRNIYIYETTFFSVLSGVNGLNEVKNYFNEVNFFDKEIIAALIYYNRQASHLWLRQELKKCKFSFICLSYEKCSRAHNIHLSLSSQSQVGLRLVSGQS